MKKNIILATVALIMTLSLYGADKITIEDFEKAHDHAYSDFTGESAKTKDSFLILNAQSSKGGVMRVKKFDLEHYSDYTLGVKLKTLEGNKAKKINIIFDDENKQRRIFNFFIEDKAEGFQELFAQNYISLKPTEYEEAFDPSKINVIHVQGAWNNDRIHIALDQIFLQKPNEKMRETREKYITKQKEEYENRIKIEEERKAKLEKCLRGGIDRPNEGPKVKKVYSAAPDILAIELVECDIIKEGQKKYEAKESDQIKETGTAVPLWTKEGIAIRKINRELHRNENKYAFYFEPYNDWTPMIWREFASGVALEKDLIDLSKAYMVYSEDVAEFKSGIEPLAVYRKSKPIDQDLITGKKAVQHIIYLKLPQNLIDGAKYKIHFRALNTRDEFVTYQHHSRKNWTESIHVNQIGYRIDDDFKRAYLSLWMGNGGGYKFNVSKFEILDFDSRNTIYTGKIYVGFPSEREEQLQKKRNFVFADVLYLDFHDFSLEGKFCIHVPGIGVSYPFVISKDKSWIDAFKISMRGLLSHRSGIELNKTFIDYYRPRNMHPTDGFKIFELEHTRLEGESESVRRELIQKFENGQIAKIKLHSDAWGGYMDAGDWDRRSQHLEVTNNLLELYQINPDFFSTLKLTLPENESKDHIPDLLNEAFWNLDFYARIQDSDGGVRGGVESTEHPIWGEASWQETLLIGVFAPDPSSSYLFASCAAKAAHTLIPIDKNMSDNYKNKAILAYDWAEKNSAKCLEDIKKRSPQINIENIQKELKRHKFSAVSELFTLTNEDKYNKIFIEILNNLDKSDIHEVEIGAMFNYTFFANEKSSAEAKEKIIEIIKNMAEISIQFAQKNAFNLHIRAPGLPMMGYVGYYSVPETIIGPLLPRAYLLTKDKKYLNAALSAAHYSAGANPINITFTTGVGSDFPRNPLHIDSRVTGQKAPDGITVYGPMDASEGWGFNTWVHTWHLQDMFPNSYTWPAAEWYVDIFLWPAMCEYTVHQTFRPTAYYWGFLGARP